MYDLDEKKLLGLIVDHVEVSKDKDKLAIHLIGGITAEFETYGDCCSYTWIEHITVPIDVLGAPIIAVKELEDDRSEDRDGELIQFYQTAFVTPRGEIIVEYRNSSNGYYGGSLTGPTFRDRH